MRTSVSTTILASLLFFPLGLPFAGAGAVLAAKKKAPVPPPAAPAKTDATPVAATPAGPAAVPTPPPPALRAPHVLILVPELGPDFKKDERTLSAELPLPLGESLGACDTKGNCRYLTEVGEGFRFSLDESGHVTPAAVASVQEQALTAELIADLGVTRHSVTPGGPGQCFTRLTLYPRELGKAAGISAERPCGEGKLEDIKKALKSVVEDVANIETDRPRGMIHVDSTPAGAVVFLNGEAVGHSPLDRSVWAAQYTVRGEREGHSTADATVEIKAGAREKLTLGIFDKLPPSHAAPVAKAVSPTTPAWGGARCKIYSSILVGGGAAGVLAGISGIVLGAGKFPQGCGGVAGDSLECPQRFSATNIYWGAPIAAVGAALVGLGGWQMSKCMKESASDRPRTAGDDHVQPATPAATSTAAAPLISLPVISPSVGTQGASLSATFTF